MTVYVDGSTGADTIGANTVSTTKIVDGAVTTVKILDANVTTAKVADANITAAKLSGAQTGSAPIYGCRAWVNFAGATGAINASGNVTSVTRNGAGDYTVNFTTAMPDANYSVSVGVVSSSSINQIMGTVGSQLAGSYRFTTVNAGVSAVDAPTTMVTFFR